MNRHVLLLLLSQLIITRICESALGKPKFVYEKTKSPRILRGNGDDNDAGYKEESAYTTTTTDSSSDEEETEGSLDSQGESDTTHIVQDDNNDSSNGQKASESGTSERVHPLSSPGAGEGVNDQSRGDGARDGLGDESAEDGGNIDHVGEDSTGDNSKGDSSRQPTSMPSKRPSVGTVAPIVISEPPTSLPSVESIEFLPIAPRMPMFKPTPTPTPSLATTTTDTTVSPTKATTSFPSPVPASLEPTFLLVSANDGNADNRSGRGGENDEEEDDDDEDDEEEEDDDHDDDSDDDDDDDDDDEVGSHSRNDGSTGDHSKDDSSRQPTSMPSKRPSVGTVAPIVISEPPTSLPSVESIEFLPIAPWMPMFKPTPTPTPSLATTTTDTTVSPTKATTSFPSPVPASLEPTLPLVSANDGNADNRSGRGGENDEEEDDDDDDGDGDDDDDEVGSHSGNDGSTRDNSKGDSSRQPTSMPSKIPSVDPFSADEGEEYNDDDYEGSYYGYQRNDEFWKDYFGDTGEQQSAPEEPSSGIEILLIYALLAGLVVWFAFGYIQRIFQSMFGGGNGYSLVDSNDTNRQRGAYPGFGSGDLEMTGYGGRTQRMEIYSPYR